MGGTHSVEDWIECVPIHLKGQNDVLFAKTCVRLVCEKLTIIPYGLLETSFYWLSGDIVRFKIEVGFRNVQKCNSHITQNGFTAARRAAMTSWRPSASMQSIYRLSADTDRQKKVKTVYPPVSLRSLGGYNKKRNKRKQNI